MKPKILIYTTRGVTSKFVQSLIEQMSFLKLYEDKYDFVLLTDARTDSAQNEIERTAKIEFSEVIHTNLIFEQIVKGKYEKWIDFYNDENNSLNVDNVKHIIIFGGLLSSACGMIREKNHLNRFLYNKEQMKFISNGKPITSILLLLKFAKKVNAKVHEICYDTCENSIDLIDIKPENYVLYHGYDFPEYNMKRLDNLQYFLLNEETIENDDTKDYDLVFGLTVLTKKREATYTRIKNSIDRIDNCKVQFFVKHKFLDIDTFVNRNHYLSYIQRSRFTLIATPYDKKQFSIYRFIESVYYDCLPLILNDVNVEDFKNTFEIPDDKIKELTVSYDNIQFLEEDRRLVLLDYFRKKVLQQEKWLKL